ncbi:MAG: hypothetical protein AAGH74_10150 [Pseudomonadota bacterium]
MSRQMDPSERILVLALMRCAEELRQRVDFPRGLPMAESMRGGDELAPVLIELIEAWCLKTAREQTPELAETLASELLLDDRSFSAMEQAISSDERLCLKLVARDAPKATPEPVG